MRALAADTMTFAEEVADLAAALLETDIDGPAQFGISAKRLTRLFVATHVYPGASSPSLSGLRTTIGAGAGRTDLIVSTLIKRIKVTPAVLPALRTVMEQARPSNFRSIPAMNQSLAPFLGEGAGIQCVLHFIRVIGRTKEF